MKKQNNGLVLLLSLFFVLLCAGRAAGQGTDANITGHVIDAKTKEHLPYATIVLKEKNIAVMADGSGHFLLKNLPVGEFTIEASMMGYKPIEVKMKTVSRKTQELNFEMEPDALILDEVVVSANRTETKRKESATIVNVANTKLFERTSSNSVSEVLNFQPGLRVEQSCSNCGVPQLRINGLEGQYSQILLDSRPIFSSLSTVYGLEQLPAAMIERVEVIRGGGSALFGSNAIAGVVNIITKEPVRNGFTLSNRTGVMGEKNWEQNTMLNGSLVSDDYRSGVFLFSMIRDRQSYDRDGDGFSEVPQLNTETIGFRAYHKPSDYSRLTAEYHHIREYRRGGNNLDLPPHEADVAEQLRHQINGGGLKFDIFSKDYQHQGNVYVSAQGINRDSYFGTNFDPKAYGKTKDLTVVGGAQYVWNAQRLWFMPAQLVVGLESNYNRLHDVQLGYDRDRLQKTYTIGGYFQNEWKNRYLSLLIGARIEKHNLIKNVVFSPRASVRYAPVKPLTFRASYAHGYRAPQAYEEDLHIAAVGGRVVLIELAPDLRPEYSHSLSLSADWVKGFHWGQITLLAEGFYTRLKDQFVLVEKGEDPHGNLILERRNAPGGTVQGFNFEARIDNLKRFSAMLGMTVQSSLYKEPLKWSEDPDVIPVRQMFRTPNLYGFGMISYNVLKNLSLSSTINVTGSMLVPHLAGYIERDRVEKTRIFTEWGLKANYLFNLSRSLKMDVEFGVKNVLDEFQPDLDRGALRDSKYIYGPALPRTIYFGLKFFM